MISKKKAQEEMVGFALIIIVVAVILLVFIGFSIRNSEKENVESYEVESFIQTALQYTTDCRDHLEPIPVQKLIIDCRNNEFCLDGRDSCEVLNNTLNGIVEESWPVSKDTVIKGYDFKIMSDGKEMIIFNKGNVTTGSKGAVQYLSSNIEVVFTAYY
tara:strand:+ start:241 stop:714 length:474 start_codon:yes stop_codon:yes gene_type:complete